MAIIAAAYGLVRGRRAAPPDPGNFKVLKRGGGGGQMLHALHKLRAQGAQQAPPPPAAAAPPGASAALLTGLRAARDALPDLPAHIARCHPLVALGERPGAGRGLFARGALRAGDQVLREAAFASCNPARARGDDAALVNGLAVHVGAGALADALPLVLALQPNRAALAAPGGSDCASALALFAPAIHCNGFTLRDDLQLLLLVAAFSNHSCVPNVASALAPGSSSGPPELVLTALRDIAAGEELLHAYVDPAAPTRDRQARLQGYGFVCACAACCSAE